MRFLAPTLLLALTGAPLIAAPASGEGLPFPKASYSADVKFENAGHQSLAHINIDGVKERRVVKLADAAESLVIIRRDKGKLYRLSPSRRVAVEMRTITAAEAGETGPPGANIDSLYGIDAMPEGHETVAGLQTTKFHVVSDAGAGKLDAEVWSTDDGIIVRIVGKNPFDSEEPPGIVEISNVVRGPQDADLFEVPKGTEVISAGKDDDAPQPGTSAPAANSAIGTPNPDAPKDKAEPADKASK